MTNKLGGSYAIAETPSFSFADEKYSRKSSVSNRNKSKCKERQ